MNQQSKMGLIQKTNQWLLVINYISNIHKTDTPIVKINIEYQVIHIKSSPVKIFGHFFSTVRSNVAKHISDRNKVLEKANYCNSEPESLSLHSHHRTRNYWTNLTS